MNVVLITHSQQAYVSVALESTKPYWREHAIQNIMAQDTQTDRQAHMISSDPHSIPKKVRLTARSGSRRQYGLKPGTGFEGGCSKGRMTITSRALPR